MNKHLYRVIFNKARGLFIAVAEIARGHTKGGGKNSRGKACQQNQPQPELFALSILPVSIGLVLGSVMFTISPAHAEIIADPSAPKNQQAIILKTSNNRLLVNIQTPSAAGVSRNAYSRLNVPKEGAIFNNSRGNVQTQLGGWVQGNPMLATGSARIILNEVNSSSPSLLRGYMEIAGQRAQMVIVNPSGISCNGCGFINTNRATLTTGAPILNGGALDGYRVQKGLVSIDGDGLDASETDYTDIIARAVRVNAGIWANDLKISAGANNVNTLNTNVNAIAVSTAAPAFAIDVANLGGMYAGKIHLIATEAGVGVKNAGAIGATVGGFTLSADGKLENTGSITSLTSSQITLKDTFLNTGNLYTQGDLSLTTQGNLNNYGKLSSGDNLAINAKNINNTVAAEISAGISTILSVGNTLTNRGLINSGNTFIDAGTLNNLGTGRIYGDHVAIQANTVNNTEETIGGLTKAAVVAARNRLDIGATTIINREHAMLFSAGDMKIGGSLDANHQAVGSAGTLNNNSATIEALGKLTLNVGQIYNTNEHFSTEVKLVSTEAITEYRGSGSANRYKAGTPNVYIYSNESLHLHTPEGNHEDWVSYNYTRTIHETQVTSSDPARILSGSSMDIIGGSLLNDNSHIIAGGALTANLGTLINTEVAGEKTTNDVGSVTNYWRHKRKGRDRTGSSTAGYNPPTAIQSISLTPTRYEQHTAITGSGTTVATVNNSLYRINPNATSGYILETDPAFASYRSWLSSDFMLNALSRNPALTRKRLGDGFYEQRLINEQINQLTGRQFLNGYDNNETQYRALMNNGITFAQAYQLSPGIELTAKQIAALTSDIVWLVEKTITLDDGSQVQALVPQVYVRLKEGDINNAGALIAANRVELATTADLTNSGTIAGRTIVNLTADNINNIGGRIHANTASLLAHTDINNIGGTITGGDQLSLQAGRDITVETTINTQTNKQDTRRNINRVAGLYVTNPNGLLQAKAGNDINLIAAQLRNDGIEGQINLQSGRDINLTTVTTSLSETTVWDASNKAYIASSAEVGSTIQSAADISLEALQDVTVRAANINSAAGDINVQARQNIVVEAGTQSQTLDESHKHTSKGFLSSKTTSTRDTLDATTSVASNLSADNVSLDAGSTVLKQNGNLTIAGSNIVASENVTLNASGDINIQASQNTHAETHYKKTKKSGLSISSSGISIGSSKASGDNILQNTSLSSAVISTQGNVTLDAGNDVNIIGSHLQANIDTNITAQRDVNITADKEFFDEKHWEKESNTGLSWSSDANSVGFFVGSKTIKVTDTALGNIVAASQIEAGSDVNITAKQNINQISSDVFAGRDINYTAENVTIIADKNTLKTSHIVEQTSNGLGVSIQHNLGSTVDAVKNAGGGENNISKASSTLAAVDAISSFTQGPSVSTHLGNSKSRDEFSQHESLAQGAVLVAQRDVNFNAIEDVTLVGADVHTGRDININAKDISIIAARNTHKKDINSESSSSGFVVRAGGNTVSAGVAYSEATSDFIADGTATTLAVLNAGQNINANADQDIHIAGAHIKAGQDINLTAGRDTLIESAKNTQQSDLDENSRHAGAGIAITAGSGGAAVGVYGEAGFSKNDLERDDKSHRNSQLNARNSLTIDSGQDTTIAGAQLEAGDVDIKTGRNLTVSSRQDTGKVEGKRTDLDVSVTVGLGYSGNISVGYGETEGEKAWVEAQTSIIGRNSVTIDTQEHIQIDGALIANIKDDGRDGGNLTLATNTLGHRDFSDKDKESSNYLNISFGISSQETNSNASAGTGDGLRSEGGVSAAGQQEDGSASTSYGIKGESYKKDRQQITRATVGEGTIIVRNDSENQDSTEGLNRDIDTAQELLKDEESRTTLYVTSSSVEAVASPTETLNKWANDLEDYGKNTTRKFIKIGDAAEKMLDSDKAAIQMMGAVTQGIVDTLDAIGLFTLGIMPSVENHGGLVTQLPALVFGDQLNNVVEVTLTIEIDKETGTERYVIAAGGFNILGKDIDIENLPADIRYAFVNGIQNSLVEAARNGAMQTGTDKILIAYNPKHGFLADLIESGWDTTMGKIAPSGNVRQLAEMVSYFAVNDIPMNFAGHSQGGLLLTRALNWIDEGILTKVDENGTPLSLYKFQLNGAAVSADAFVEAGKKAGVKLTKDDFNINPADPVPQLIGMNAENTAEVLEATLNLINLFDASKSPHSSYVCQGDFCDDKQPGIGGIAQ